MSHVTSNQINFVSQDDLDELEESAWHVASVLPAIPNFVHPSLEVVLFPNGQRGVVVTASWHNFLSQGKAAIRVQVLLKDSFFVCEVLKSCYVGRNRLVWIVKVDQSDFGKLFFPPKIQNPQFAPFLWRFFQFKSGNLVASRFTPYWLGEVAGKSWKSCNPASCAGQAW